MTVETKISRWDTTEVLKTQEDIDIYLEVAFESNDSKQIAKAFGNAARAQDMLGKASREEKHQAFMALDGILAGHDVDLDEAREKRILS